MMLIIGAEGEAPEPLVTLAVAALFGSGIWIGVRTWRGQVPARVARYEHQHGPRPSILGSPRQYQTRLGVGYLGFPAGIGGLMCCTEFILRWIFSADDEWWVAWVLIGPGFGLMAVSVVLMMAYFWTGLPDFMRPPCQRGWKMTNKGLVLVRPERFHEHPKYRPPDVDGRVEPKEPIPTSELTERLRLRPDDE